MKLFQPKPDSREHPYIIAHRGVPSKAPENTLASFQKSLEVSGVSMIELDVRLTKDEEVIVLHDRTLQRTSVGNGPARDYALAEIKRFDAGSWFHPQFSQERVPTLAEVLQLVKNRLWVDVEIKSDWLHREPSGLLEERVLQVVTSCGMMDQVMFSSFDHRVLATLKQLHPQVVTGVLYNFYVDFVRMPSSLAQHVGASIFVCAKHELSRRMLDDAHAHGIAVYVYTLNSIEDAQKMVAYGVDGIMSNNVDEIIDVLNHHPQKH
jgi:glycerophosphoryl diester phosphodiesterase